MLQPHHWELGQTWGHAQDFWPSSGAGASLLRLEALVHETFISEARCADVTSFFTVGV